ncbi:MAG: hypothetical protein GXP36_12725 [Actinobacteria bacterium]|nr:hypothetical protein [Actinomycetota bacterium]
MQWEYHIEETSGGYGVWPDTEKMALDLLLERLNKLGSEGWELTLSEDAAFYEATTAALKGHVSVLIFKRQTQAEPGNPATTHN